MKKPTWNIYLIAFQVGTAFSFGKWLSSIEAGMFVLLLLAFVVHLIHHFITNDTNT